MLRVTKRCFVWCGVRGCQCNQQLERDIAERITRDSDGRGEASETRSGSTEGESADPKGIAKDSRP